MLLAVSGTLISATVEAGGLLVVLPGVTDTTPNLEPGAVVISTGVVIYQPGQGVQYDPRSPRHDRQQRRPDLRLRRWASRTRYCRRPGVGDVFSGGTASGTDLASGLTPGYSYAPAGALMVSSGGVASATTSARAPGIREFGGRAVGAIVRAL